MKIMAQTLPTHYCYARPPREGSVKTVLKSSQWQWTSLQVNQDILFI